MIYCDICGKKMKKGEDFRSVKSRQIGKNDEIKEFENVFICEKCFSMVWFDGGRER